MMHDLVNWYVSHCDGEWEHGYGITIETLDNPGWAVNITGASDKQDFHIKTEGDKRWLHIKATSTEFSGYGDESRLVELLSIATKWLNNDIE